MEPVTPRLSIIIPTLNEAEHIASLLDDLRSQSCASDQFEIIVVDGDSDDDTRAVAQRYTDKVTRVSPGRAAQMNAGAAMACGDILWFVHADSRVPPDAAAHVLQATTSTRPWGRFDVRLSGRQRLLRVVEYLMNLRSAVSGVATGDQGIFVQRTVFESVGGFAQQPLMEDIALSKSLCRFAKPIRVKTPMLITSSRRWESRGIIRTILLMWRLRLAYAFGVPPGTLARLYR